MAVQARPILHVRVARPVRAACFREVRSFNPYWNVAGRSFEDPDGDRVVLQHGTWPVQ